MSPLYAPPARPALTPAMVGEYIGQVATATSAGSPGEGTLFLVPVIIGRALTIDQLAVNITIVGGAGSVIRLGIYNDNGLDLPGALLLDAGTVQTETTIGLKAITVAQALSPGRYWFAGVQQGGASGVTTTNTTGSAAPSGAIASGSLTAVLTGRVKTSVSGALPNPAGATTASSSSVMRVMARVAS